MFTVIKKQTRPNKETLFYTEKYPTVEKYNMYFHEKYIKTGKFIKSEKHMTDDGLTMIGTTVWQSHLIFLEFVTDDVCYNNVIEPSNAYNKSSDIETEFSIIEE